MDLRPAALDASTWRRRALAVTAAAAWVAACAAPLPPAATTVAGSSLPDIEQLIGDAACSADTDCRVTGVGAKACGGPEAYRAWSVLRTSPAVLEDVVTRNAAARRSELQRQEMASTCSVVPVPPVTCKRGGGLPTSPGVCTLLPARAGS